jgi:hypothetical protein
MGGDVTAPFAVARHRKYRLAQSRVSAAEATHGDPTVQTAIDAGKAFSVEPAWVPRMFIARTAAQTHPDDNSHSSASRRHPNAGSPQPRTRITGPVRLAMKA